MKKDFVFVSGNINKVRWLEKFIGRRVDHHSLDLEEIQSMNLISVVEHKAKEAHKHLRKNVLIEDTALQFNALGGLPGPFIKFFLESIGNDGLCRLLDSFDDRSAVASVIYGYYDGGNFRSFGAAVEGTISQKPKGDKGMGWDSIFVPLAQAKTYAEMDEDEHDQYSVRNMAVKKLISELT